MGWYTCVTITFKSNTKCSLLDNYLINEKGYYETGFDNKRHISVDDIFQFIEYRDIHCMYFIYKLFYNLLILNIFSSY